MSQCSDPVLMEIVNRAELSPEPESEPRWVTVKEMEFLRSAGALLTHNHVQIGGQTHTITVLFCGFRFTTAFFIPGTIGRPQGLPC